MPELPGFPFRVNVGEKSLAKGEIEIKPRSGTVSAVKVDEAAARITALVRGALAQFA